MKFIKIVKKFLNKINSDHIGEYAANSAYYTFLSFIPFIILLISLIKYANIERSTLIYILEAVLPTVAKESVLDIIQEVYSKSIGTVSISAIFTLWSSTKGFYSLGLGISSIYKGGESSEKKDNYILLRVKGMLGTIFIIFSIIMVLILLVFGNRINDIMQEYFPNAYMISSFIINIRSIIVIIALFIFFLLIYRFILNKRGNRLKHHIPGAIFASVRLGFSFILFFNICRCFYKLFGYIWQSCNNNFNYDVAVYNNLYNFIRR